MSIRMFFLTFMGVAGLSSAIAQTTTTTATRQFAFPPTGIGSSETAEINVANVAANSTSGTAASCTGNIMFQNAAGTTVGTATAFTLTAGQITSAHVPFSSIASSGTRAVLRGIVQLTVSTATPRPPCSLQVSLEVYDTATSATHVILTSDGLGTPAGLR